MSEGGWWLKVTLKVVLSTVPKVMSTLPLKALTHSTLRLTNCQAPNAVPSGRHPTNCQAASDCTLPFSYVIILLITGKDAVLSFKSWVSYTSYIIKNYLQALHCVFFVVL